MLRPPSDLGADACGFKLALQYPLNLPYIILALGALGVEHRRYAFVGFWVQLLERQVFKLPLNLPDAQPMG